jgi:hypothetical protein
MAEKKAAAKPKARKPAAPKASVKDPLEQAIEDARTREEYDEALRRLALARGEA